MLLQIIFVTIPVIRLTAGHTIEPEDELSEILRTYKYHQRPKDFKPYGNVTSPAVLNPHPPLTVEVSLEIAVISAVNILHMDMSVVFMLIQRWKDPRLKLTSTAANETISISYFHDSIWLPDLNFRNAKVTNRHAYPRRNQFVWLRGSDGQVVYSQKISGTFNCHMKLWNFPFDTQICRIEMGSYGYPNFELQFQWWNNGSRAHQGACFISPNMPNNEYHQPVVRLHHCESKYSTTGTFSCISAEIVLSRQCGFYLTFAYFPSFLIILVNWIQFVIDPNAVPARITLGLLSVLALITQKAATAAQLPRVSYVKAIDVWFVGCLVLVVLSLLEFAIVNQLNLRKRRQRVSQMSSSSRATSCRLIQLLHQLCQDHLKCLAVTNDLDTICRYLYPLVFLIFNVAYWLYYLSPAPV